LFAFLFHDDFSSLELIILCDISALVN